MSQVKDGLAKAWASQLAQEAGFPFFSHRHDQQTAPPFGVVLVKSLRPLAPGVDVHVAEVRVVVVADISDGAAAEHQARVQGAYAALEETQQQGRDAEYGIQLYGFMIEEIQQASGAGDDGKKIHSDVFLITAGVGSVG